MTRTDLWDPQRGDTYNVETGPDGRISVHGYYHLDGVVYIHRGHEQSATADIRYRGRISVIDTCTGMIMQMRGSSRRQKISKLCEKGKEIDDIVKSGALNITMEVTCQSLDPEAIQAAIAIQARRIATKYASSIYDAGINAEPGSQLVSALGPQLQCYIRQVSNSRKWKESTRNRHRCAIERVMGEVGGIRARDLTERKLCKIYKKPDDEDTKRLRYMAGFWAWLMDKGYIISNVGNVFETFLAQKSRDSAVHPRRKAPEKLIKKMLSPKSLPKEVELNLNMVISAAAPDDAMATGMLLIKEVGLTVSQALALTWRDILISGDDWVRVRMKIDSSAGATHLYVIPVSSYAAGELIRRHKVVADEDDTVVPDHPAKDANKLAAYCRREVYKAGAYDDLVSRYPELKSRGEGAKLLIRNYHYRISRICGGAGDPGACDYLCHLSLSGNVTADHYRSFTSPDGQEYLTALVRRDGRYNTLDNRATVRHIQLDDGRYQTMLRSPCAEESDRDRLTTGSVSIILQPGDTCDISCLHGMTASIVTEVLPDPPSAKKVDGMEQLTLFGMI